MSRRTCWLVATSVALFVVCMSGCSTAGKKASSTPSTEAQMPAAQAAPEPAPGFAAPAGESESTEPGVAAGGAGIESETAEPAETGEAAAPHKAVKTSRHAAIVGATVTMGDRAFTPGKVTIGAGQSVRWKNSSKSTQSVTADHALAKKKGSVSLPKGAKSFNSGDMKPGATYTHTFTVAGTYKYFSTRQESKGMVGEVIVEKAKASKSTAKKKHTTSTK